MSEKKDLTRIGLTAFPHEDAFPSTPDEPGEQVESFESLEELTANSPEPEQAASLESPPQEFITEFEEPVAEPSQVSVIAIAEESPPPLAVEIPVVISSSADPMDQVKTFSEKLADASSTSVAAAFPFTLKITGRLSVEEQERILELVSRENMGFREIDLEPQFAAGRLLIPRISEYAGVLLIQALRGTSGRIEFFPSDTADLAVTEEPPSTAVPSGESRLGSSALKLGELEAERLPVTSGESLPQFHACRVIDTVTATTTLHINAVEFQNAPQYQEALDALHRELKYKAFRKGAVGITHYKIELTSLSFPSRYRILVSGSAVGILVT